MLKTIKLYGSLGREFGKVHRIDVDSPLQAVRALCALHPGFKQKFAKGSYRVILDNAPVTVMDELRLPAREIKFAPAVSGAGHAGIGEILLGAVLIVASFYVGPEVQALGGSAAFGAAASSAIFSLGMTLTLSGIAQALAQPPQTSSANSYLFGGAVNTTHQGNPVPILYGRMIIGSQVASASLQAYDIAIGPATTNTGSTTVILPNGTTETTNSSTFLGAYGGGA